MVKFGAEGWNPERGRERLNVTSRCQRRTSRLSGSVHWEMGSGFSGEDELLGGVRLYLPTIEEHQVKRKGLQFIYTMP